MFKLVKFNPYLVGINLLMILIGYVIVTPSLKYPYSLTRNRRLWAYILLMLFCMAAFWGSDYFHIYDDYNELVSDGWELEYVYHLIAKYLAPNNYFLWRFIVWGCASLLVVKTFERVKIKQDLAICFFVMIWMLWFSYARVSLAMAMAFYGLAIFSTSRTSLFSWLQGLIFLLSSLFFHKSAGFIVIVSLLALLLPYKGNKRWLVILFSFPLLIYLFRAYLSDFLIGDISSNNEEISSYIARGQNYMNSDNYVQGIGYLIGQLLERVPYYMIFISSITLLVRHNNLVKNDSVKVFMKAIVLLILIASVFAFDVSLNTQLINERFMRFSFIPSCILLTYFWSNGIYPKWQKWTFNIAWIGTLYQISYMLYCSMLYKGV